MTSQQRVLAALNHHRPDRVPFDIGGSLATGINVAAYQALKEFPGLDMPTVLASRRSQTAVVDDAVRERLEIDTVGILARGPSNRGKMNTKIKEVRRMASYRLMIPGPVDVEDAVLAEMASPVPAHYGEAWMRIYRETIGCLKQVFQTENDLFIMGGPGSAALDASFGSLLATGEKVLIPSNGFFGQRLRAMADSYGLEVVPLDFSLEEAISAAAVEAHLQKEKGIQAVAVVHHETSTGVLNPLQEIAAVINKARVPIIVDAVASLGGVPLPVDEWGIDLCVTVSNKCLAAPPGISLISISQRAWEIMESKSDRSHGWYLNLQTWKQYATEWAGWHPYPTTMASNNVLALLASLKQLLAEGLETRCAKIAKAAGMTREGLTDMGFEMFVEGPHASPLITAAKDRPDMSIVEMARFLKDECGIMIGGGIDELAGKIFRVGHMGKAISPEYIEAFLSGVRDFLQRKGLEAAQSAVGI